MKAYGLKRICGVEWPDVADIKEFGLPSRTKHCGSKTRQSARRYQRKLARAAGKKFIREAIREAA